MRRRPGPRLPRLPAAALRITAALLLSLSSFAIGRAAGGRAPALRYLVIIVMDGFRPDYMALAPMRHLHSLMRSGTTFTDAWVGQLETETPTGHATIVTGVYPRKHGVIGFGWRGPTGAFTWIPTDLRQLDAGDMESLIEAGGVPTLSDLLHRAYPGAKSASLSGEKYYAADAMGTGADYVLYGKRVGRNQDRGLLATPIGSHIPPSSTHYQAADTTDPPYPEVQDQFVARLAVRLLQTVRPRMMLINLPGSDIQGHLSGGLYSLSRVKTVVAGVDRAIGVILDGYRKAGLYGNTDFVVTADHGMVPSTHIVPREQMYSAVRATNAPALEEDFLTTAGYLYLRDAAQAPSVAARLAAQRFPGVEGAIYRSPSGSGCAAEESTARTLGPGLTRAYIDLCDTIAAPSGPEVVLPYAEDSMGLVVPGSRHWGNHGGLSWRVQHIPLVLSGPGVKAARSAFPAELVDIAPTVERLLALPIPSGVDGVVLAGALARPSGADWTGWRSVDASRSQDVAALRAHSLAQHGAVLASDN
ncbi:MAG: alkaline phosphatase family protein [Chloroflexi bacterium]|nr:alkaline phosphatase family protein [Chloroflexota bacterium]